MATPRWETSLRRRPDLYSQRRASRGQPGYPFPNRTTGDGGRRQMSDPPSYWPLHSLLRRVTRCAVTDGQVLRKEKSNWRSHSSDHCIGQSSPWPKLISNFLVIGVCFSEWKRTRFRSAAPSPRSNLSSSIPSAVAQSSPIPDDRSFSLRHH